MPAEGHRLFAGTGFDPETIAAMVEAFEAACEGLPEAVSREIIAKTIIVMAGAGEHDAEKLSQFAILSLQDDLSARRLRF